MLRSSRLWAILLLGALALPEFAQAQMSFQGLNLNDESSSPKRRIAHSREERSIRYPCGGPLPKRKDRPRLNISWFCTPLPASFAKYT